MRRRTLFGRRRRESPIWLRPPSVGEQEGGKDRGALARRTLLAIGLLAVVVLVAWKPATGGEKSGELTGAATLCDRYASTSGDDSSRGTRSRPYRTVARLLSRLAPGRTGCLLPGTFEENLTIRRGGGPGVPIRLRSAPGGIATIRGRFWIAASADYVTVRNLRLDGRNKDLLPSPTVNGDYATFLFNDVTNYRAGAGYDDGQGICFNIGSSEYGTSTGTVIARNRIHDCGISNNHNHGIYVSSARGLVVRNNYIYDNGDRGIQLYPDADDSLIERNIIDGNGSGVIFSAKGDRASDGNLVRWNVITNSQVRWNVEEHYSDGDAVGSGNRVVENCVWASNRDDRYNRNGGVEPEPRGFALTRNKVADPRFLNRAAKRFRLTRGSPCAGLGPR